MVLGTAFPVILPVILGQLVNGSLLTTVLRLRAARRELAAKRHDEDQNVDDVVQLAAVRQTLTGVAA